MKPPGASTVADVVSYMERTIARRQAEERRRDKRKRQRKQRWQEAQVLGGDNPALETFLEHVRKMLKEVHNDEDE